MSRPTLYRLPVARGNTAAGIYLGAVGAVAGIVRLGGAAQQSQHDPQLSAHTFVTRIQPAGFHVRSQCAVIGVLLKCLISTQNQCVKILGLIAVHRCGHRTSWKSRRTLGECGDPDL